MGADGGRGLVQKKHLLTLKPRLLGTRSVLPCDKHEDGDLVRAPWCSENWGVEKAGQLMKCSVLHSYHVAICPYI